jgi:GxxExxY protein
MDKSKYQQLSREILDSAIMVHKEMGPGLLESVYEYCLIKELNTREISVDYQLSIPLSYKGYVLDKIFRVDLMVEKEIIIEIKAVDALLPVHEAQIISYLKLADKKLGFLINFNVVLLKDGFKRFVNHFFI